MTTFSSRDNVKSIQVRYIIVNVASPYNIIIGIPTFNALEAELSTLCLTLKYPLEDGWVGIENGDQEIASKCYKDSLRLKRRSHNKNDQLKVTLVDIDQREEAPENQLTTRENIRKIHNSVQSPHTTQIGEVGYQ